MILSINNVKPGLIVGENIYNKDDNILLLSGTILTAKNIEMLKSNGITKLNIIYTPNLGPVVKETINESIRNTLFNSLKKLNVQELQDTIKDVVTKILNTKYLQYNLNRYLNDKDKFYNHAINVCIFSVALGKAHNENCPNRNYQVNLLDLANSAILHNVGKICENKDVLSKIDPIKIDRNKFPGFDSNCFINYNKDMHIVYAYSLLRNNPLINQATKTAILFSQENEKGTGTLGASSDFTSRREKSMIMSKIIHIASIYDSILYKILEKNTREHRESLSDIIEIMEYAKNNGILNPELTDLFLNNIPIYSIGNRVKLSDGTIGIVIDYKKETLAYPIIQIESTGIIIDLANIKTISIITVCDNQVNI